MRTGRCCAALVWVGVLSTAPAWTVTAATPDRKPALEVPAARVEPRMGLGNVRAKLDAGEPITIAYLGGSLTELPGWRDGLTRSLRQQYPDQTITQINAGLSGTGSRVGVFRVDHEVLTHEPDLVIIEFAANDVDSSPHIIVRCLEGIVRKIRAANPRTDILFVYLFAPQFIGAFDRGELPKSIRAQEAVAAHYGIPSIEAASVIDRLQRNGSVLLRGPGNRPKGATPVFGHDGLHPYRFGHQLYTRAITDGLEKILHAPPKPGQTARLPPPLLDDHWQHARRVPLSAVKPGPGWRRKTTRNGKETHHRPGEVWEATELGASIEFRFRGKALKIYEVRGEKPGDLAISVDGEELPMESFRRSGPVTRLQILEIRRKFDPGVTHHISIRVTEAPGESEDFRTVALADLLVLGEVLP